MCVACCAIASVGVGLPGHSNAGILAAVSLGLAALAWPSLLCLPYLLLLAGAVLAWSASASSPAGSRSMRVVQVYAGLPLDAAVLHTMLFAWTAWLVYMPCPFPAMPAMCS